MDKLEFTDWSEVQRRFGSVEIVIFQQRMMITPTPPGIIRVKTICLGGWGCGSKQNNDTGRIGGGEELCATWSKLLQQT